MKLTTCLSLLAIFCLVLAGCGGSGGGSTSSGSGVSALKVADKVSVVDAQESSGTEASLKGMSMGVAGFKAAGDLPSTSDYATDETFVYVEERSAESFETINEILCMMAQTRYDQMLNQGDYIAQIDVNQCSNSKDSASSAGESSTNQSSGANATEYEYWTVNSTRADSSSPQVFSAWVHESADDEMGEPAKTIRVKGEITEGRSSSNPYGLFTMNFKAHPDGSPETTIFYGYLKSVENESGEVLLKFFNDGDFGGFTFTQKVTLNRSSDGSAGSGSIYINESGGFGSSTKSFDIAYNDSYFYRSDGSTDVCLSRSNPDSTAWRYGMYYDENHATPGARVSMSSGFPIKVTQSGTEYQGWVGYYGLWFPSSVSLTNGDTVYKQQYSNGTTTETPYTVFISRGKLRKHTRKTVTLEEIANVPISWNECTDDGGGNWTCVDTRVEWNSSTEKLMKTAVRSDATNWVWQEITPAEVTFDSSDWDFSFYSESLGGSGRVNLRDPVTGGLKTLGNSTNVVFHVESTVFPGDTLPASLACFEDCIDPASVDTSSPYYTDSTWEAETNLHYQATDPASATYYTYTVDNSTMELQRGGSAVVMTDNTENPHGVWTGALFEPTAENLSQLACEWESGSTCAWQAWDKLDVFYTWETGTQEWNKLTALKDGSTFLSFDPPLSVEYTHTWDDSTTSKFFLEYNGFGDLHGIPGKCVDMDTGSDVDCWDSSGEKYIRWVPQFSIPTGSAVTDAVTGDNYYVKALEKEERMRSITVSDCTNDGLSLQTYSLPDASLYEDPAIGSEPDVDAAPAVIGGVVQ